MMKNMLESLAATGKIIERKEERHNCCQRPFKTSLEGEVYEKLESRIHLNKCTHIGKIQSWLVDRVARSIK